MDDKKIVGLCPPSALGVKFDDEVKETMERKARDIQVGGDHYKNSKHQPYEVLLERHGYECFRGACLKDIDKYLARYKDNRLEDYKKAQHLLDWLVEETENEEMAT